MRQPQGAAWKPMRLVPRRQVFNFLGQAVSRQIPTEERTIGHARPDLSFGNEFAENVSHISVCGHIFTPPERDNSLGDSIRSR